MEYMVIFGNMLIKVFNDYKTAKKYCAYMNSDDEFSSYKFEIKKRKKVEGV